MKAFRIYVVVVLTLITLLLGALVGGLIYVGKKVQHTSSIVTNKVDTFNQNVSQVNNNLRQISNQLQAESNSLSRTNPLP